MYLEKELKEIIKIKSVSSDIGELNNCLDYCINFVNSNKKILINKKEFNDVPSILFSNSDTTKFDVLAVGHIDVVPAKDELFEPKLVDSKLYGRGSADMKSGVLVALDLLKNIADKDIKYGVLVVSDEETGGKLGARKWAELGLNADIILDYDSGDGFGFVSQKSKGVVIMELETRGIEAHGSMSWEGLDANDIMIDTINELRKNFKNFSIRKKPKNQWISTMHIGTISGGDSINKISANCKATLDFRLTDKYRVRDISAMLNKIIDNNDYDGKLFYKMISYGEAIYSDTDNEHFKKYMKILKKELGKSPKLTVFNGTTDARYFVNGNNVVIHHNSDIGAIHSDVEYVDLITLEKLKKVGLEFLLNYANT